MRFIDVTRYGGVKTLRLSVAAIAYVDACEGGSVVRLVGGESLRVNEDCKTVEARASEADGVMIPEGNACGRSERALDEYTAGVDVTADALTVELVPKRPARKGKRK